MANKNTKRKQIRKIHLDDDVWTYLVSGSSAIVYTPDRRDSNIFYGDVKPSEVKEWIIYIRFKCECGRWIISVNSCGLDYTCPFTGANVAVLFYRRKCVECKKEYTFSPDDDDVKTIDDIITAHSVKRCGLVFT